MLCNFILFCPAPCLWGCRRFQCKVWWKCAPSSLWSPQRDILKSGHLAPQQWEDLVHTDTQNISLLSSSSECSQAMQGHQGPISAVPWEFLLWGQFPTYSNAWCSERVRGVLCCLFLLSILHLLSFLDWRWVISWNFLLSNASHCTEGLARAFSLISEAPQITNRRHVTRFIKDCSGWDSKVVIISLITFT